MRRSDGVPEELVTQIIFDSAEVGGNYQPLLRPYQLKPETHDLIGSQYVDDESLAHDVITHITAEHIDGDKPFGEMPCAKYQLWNSLDWRKAHDEPESAQRFMDKLGEELEECIEAYRDMRANPESKEARGEFVSELGDVLFCATACATIARADVERGTARELLDVYGESVRYPSLSYIDEKVRTGLDRKDELFPDGQFPYFVWNLANHEDVIEYDLRPELVLPQICYPLLMIMSPIADADELASHGSPHFEIVEELCGKLNLFVSMYAQYYANSSFEEVVAKNIDKISGRVVEGSLVDRSRRSEDTL